jgi:alpha-1,2-mannosyltransferase
MLARLDVPTSLALLAVAAVGVTALVISARVDRDGDPVFGVALCGMATAAVSPFSWGYHWVWFVPLAVVVLHGAIVRRRAWCIAGAALLIAVTAGWIVGYRAPASGQLPPLGVIAFEQGGWTEHVTRSAYLIVFAVALAAAARRLRFDQKGVGGVFPPAVPVSSSS